MYPTLLDDPVFDSLCYYSSLVVKNSIGEQPSKAFYTVRNDRAEKGSSK